MRVPTLRRLRFLWREEGGRRFLLRAATKARAMLWSREEWLVYGRSGEEAAPEFPHIGLSVAELSFADLTRFRFFKALEVPEILELRFSRGERCFGFLFGEELAHVAWVTCGYLPLDMGIPEIENRGGTGIYDCYTLPEFRKRGVYKRVLATLLEISRCEGSLKVQIAVDRNNTPSRRAIEAVGFVLSCRAVATQRIAWTSLRLEPIPTDFPSYG